MSGLPAYLEDRVRRQPPIARRVVRGSTPVVSFGDASTARVATLGLNPSRREFCDVGGRLLCGEERRLETLESLDVRRLHNAPDGAVRKVIQGCYRYFHGNVYGWFKPLQVVLDAVGRSFARGSACHLDLVQWATDPTWAKLARKEQLELLLADAWFLGEQLRNERIRVVLANGRGVADVLEQVSGVAFRRASADLVVGSVTARFTRAEIAAVPIITWSTNLQSSFGVSSELVKRIGGRVARIARGL